MTSVVANSSGRSGKPVRGKNQTQTSNSSGVGDSHNDKFQPTAEQMRIASLMTDKKDPDGDLKPKIDQIVELTGTSRDEAAIALHDCDNDMAKAIEMILDGETLESEWQSTGKKKKQKNVAPTSTALDSTSSAPINGQKNGDDRKFDKTRKDRNGASEENGTNKNLENGKPLRIKDPNFKPRERRFDGPGGREDRPPRNFQNQGDTFSSEGEGFNGERRSGGFSGRGGRGGGLSGRGRGAPRGGRGGGRGGGVRNFGSRPGGPNNSDKPTDEVLGSIDTWTNEPKPDETSSVNTMKVGNWSDFNGQEWNENWNDAVQPIDNKVFNISNDKNGPQPVTEQKPTAPAQMSFLSAASKSIEKEQQQQQQQQQQQAQTTQATSNASYGSIASREAKRNESVSSAVSQQQSQSQQPSVPSQQQTQVPAVAPGRALLNQIQQQPQAPPPSQMNQGFGGLNQYNKNATESIKSLVGLSASGALAESMQQPPQQDKQLNAAANRMNSSRTKAQESAVEMPANDISNLNLHFGSLDFGQNSSSNQQQQTSQNQQPPSFANISNQANQQEQSSSIFEQGPPSVQKSDKNISLMEGPGQNSTGYRGASTQSNQTKNVLSNLNDVLHSNNEKLNTSGNSYSSKKDYMMSYKSSSYNDNYNSGAPGYNAPSQQSSQSNYSNYNANQTSSFGNSASSGQNLMGSGANFNSSTYGSNNTSGVATGQSNKDNSGASQSSVNNASTTAATSSAPNSLGMMSNSTNTTNVLKSTLPATGKGVHNNIPPGVQQPFAQPLNIPPQFIMNNGVPVPYQPFYDLSQYNRDTGYANYPSDMKINRGSEADFNPASSQAAGVVQSMAGQQAHNPGNFIPSLAPSMVPYFYGFPHGQYALNPSFYTQMPQTTVSNTAFGKNTGNSYTHSYNSGYDNMAPSVAGGQSQDYGLKPNYSQQMQHNKPMQSGAPNSDLGSGNTNGNGQSMYNKSHSQMNKNFDKQGGFQQNNQFLGGNNGLGYGNANAYMMQQPMINDQPGQTSGNQRPMKGNVGGPNSNYKPLWN